MGLSESKIPFETDNATPVKYKQEIGICHEIVDPRSPTNEFQRTPIYSDNDEALATGKNEEIVDPRSPSVEIQRTPVTEDILNKSFDEEIDNELTTQIERLKLFDTPEMGGSSENLSNQQDILQPKQTVLKLLADEPSVLDTTDPLCILPTTPQSQSTPYHPITPVSRVTETDKLLKKRKKTTTASRENKKEQQLKKNVLRKAFNEQQRSPLAIRNAGFDKYAPIDNKKRTASKKTTGFTKFNKKYNNLDESYTEVFSGKENEVW